MFDLRYLRYWHSRYNKLVFEGKLSRPAIIIESCAPVASGYCEATTPVTIYIDPTLTKVEARQILLHEMIHQWQIESGLPMDHGRSFKQWETPCELLTGLRPWL